MSTTRPTSLPKARKAVRRVLAALDQTIAAGEQAKRAKEALRRAARATTPTSGRGVADAR